MRGKADPPLTAGQFGPAVYAEWRASSLGEITETLEHRLIFRLTGSLQGQSFLDVGCGDGTLAFACAQEGAAWVSGCDLDRRMVAKARAKAASDGIRIGLAVAGAGALPFADASFDVVTCITMLTFVKDADHAVREMARVLRPGGRLVIGDLNKWSFWAARRRIRGWLGATLWRAARFRTARQLAAMAEDAGLTVGSVEGAIFFPPWTALARLMAPLDRTLGRLSTMGAAFVAIKATKP
jgi:ubiquinone/menaquinone biosynthesis C-methylase UbiE